MALAAAAFVFLEVVKVCSVVHEFLDVMNSLVWLRWFLLLGSLLRFLLHWP
jgi:hypothetical protein